jgi:hypothetical protein
MSQVLAPLDLEFTPGKVYLVVGSDQQIKLELRKRGISYRFLYHPSYGEVEEAFAEDHEDPFSTSLEAVVIIPKSYKTTRDRTAHPDAVPNYQKLIVSPRKIGFIVGNPYQKTNELSDYYKKLQGGQFEKLVLPNGYAPEAPESYQRFPLTFVKQQEAPSGDFIEGELFKRKMKSLGTKEGIADWFSIRRSEFYLMFLEREKSCVFIDKLFFDEDYKCRDLIPWLSPFVTRLNKERWNKPGNLLGRFALWVYRTRVLWKESFKEGLKWISSNNRSILIFNPSKEAVNRYWDYLEE